MWCLSSRREPRKADRYSSDGSNDRLGIGDATYVPISYTVDSILSRDWIMQKQLALIFRHTVSKRTAAVECQSLRYADVLRCPNMQSESYGPKPWIDGAVPSSVR